MELTENQIESIIKLAGCSWEPEKIAHYLGIPEEEFMEEFNNAYSALRYHYERGVLINQATLDLEIMERAKGGNLMAIQMIKKDMYFRSIENFKTQQESNRIRSEVEAEYARIQEYVEKGRISNLPDDLAEYFEQMDYIRSLYNKWNSRSHIIKMVCLKWKNVSPAKAEHLYADTLNFFYLDNQVKVEAWANIYADKLDELAAIARAMNDSKTAGQLNMDAAKLRGVGKEKPPELPKEFFERKPTIYFLDPKMFGIEKVDRRELAEFLDTLDITVLQKQRLLKDAGTEEVFFEILEPQEDAEDQDNT
ncbi:MAG: hypothetical protein D4R67_11950 [Bacteroidetes bacterium]|nr:MAG: hypothetical protein D4R67_11950 [Bacteroidota bacterium]